jgi:RimJ/RimL family protein N-acetyltransferase
MTDVLRTERLTLRPWRVEDAETALEIFGDAEVSRWLSPAMENVRDLAAMRVVLQQWIAEDARAVAPLGRWAIELSEDGRVIGGVALLYLPPGDEDLEIAVQLAPDMWGRGLASEAGHRVAQHALEHDGVEEVFAVARPSNARAAAMAKRMGMEWVGETDKYYDLSLNLYRVRLADLDEPGPSRFAEGSTPGG